MANIITGCRVLCSILLLFCSVQSPQFISLYLIAGFTDMVDGTVARMTNTVSRFGSRLDTIADFVFITICLYKLLPTFTFPIWIWSWIVVIAVIKFINILVGFIIHKHFVAEHTIMNKLTGLLLFLLPVMSIIIELKYCVVVVCVVATFAAVQEGYYIKAGKIIDESWGEIWHEKKR